MRNDLTEIVAVIDRSGSMRSCCQEAENGFNHFIEEQKKLPGDVNLTLVQFDNEYEFIHRGVPIRDVPPYSLQPRGMTALCDALGRAIKETGERLAALPESMRPGGVMVIVVTDGQENASQEYNAQMVKEMIQHQEQKYSWQFTYLGAHANAIAEAHRYGIAAGKAAQFAGNMSDKAYANVSSKAAVFRAANAAGSTVDDAAMNYTDDERKSMV